MHRPVRSGDWWSANGFTWSSGLEAGALFASLRVWCYPSSPRSSFSSSTGQRFFFGSLIEHAGQKWQQLLRVHPSSSSIGHDAPSVSASNRLAVAQRLQIISLTIRILILLPLYPPAGCAGTGFAYHVWIAGSYWSSSFENVHATASRAVFIVGGTRMK